MSKTILVFINGHAGVGKDTFVNFCKDYAEKEKSCKVYNVHRSDASKRALQTLGWSGEKDEDTRKLLKEMVDFMEKKGLLNQYLDTHLKFSRATNSCDLIVFYHVRDPEIIYSLMNEYIDREGVRPISLLLKRDIDKPAEPDEWWGNLENGDYTMSIQLPPDDLNESAKVAARFVDFLIDSNWVVVKQEEASWTTNI